MGGLLYMFFKKPEHWAVYYNKELPPENFLPYDLLVFDRDGHPPLEILRDGKRIILGYISFGEAEPNRVNFPEVEALDVLIYNVPGWKGGAFIDVRKPQWQAYLLDTIIPAAQLSNCLRGVICQHLIPRADQTGRVLATEILTLNSAMGRCIRDRRFAQMPGLIQIGAQDGMHTIDDSLLHLLTNDFILLDDALAHCRDKHFIRENFHKMMKERIHAQKAKK
jgi:hypothetical protein